MPLQDGAVIQNMYDVTTDFWDDHFKQVDVDMTGVDIAVGVGYEFRALSGRSWLASMENSVCASFPPCELDGLNFWKKVFLSRLDRKFIQ